MTDCTRTDGHHRKEDGRPVVSGRYAYRTAYEAVHGPLRPDQHLHHLCGNKWCVTVEHLQPMSDSEHVRAHGAGGDWGQRNKTHCPAGHEYAAPGNTYLHGNERHCIPCRRATKRRFRARQASRRLQIPADG